MWLTLKTVCELLLALGIIALNPTGGTFRARLQLQGVPIPLLRTFSSCWRKSLLLSRLRWPWWGTQDVVFWDQPRGAAAAHPAMDLVSSAASGRAASVLCWPCTASPEPFLSNQGVVFTAGWSFFCLDAAVRVMSEARAGCGTDREPWGWAGVCGSQTLGMVC